MRGMRGVAAAISATAAAAPAAAFLTFLACAPLLASGCGGASGADEERLAASDAVAQAKSGPGWSALAPDERRALAALLDGRDNPWSPRAREALRDVLADRGWATSSATQQADTLRGLWRHPSVRPRNVATLALAHRDRIADYTLVADVTLGPTELPGGTADAQRWAMHVDGRVLTIDAPTTPPREGVLLSAEEIASAVARLPAGARAEIDSVVLVPFRNPADASYAEDLGIPDFRTFMEGRSTGRIMVYPRTHVRVDATDMLLHEVAHVWTLRDLTAEQWEAWSAAREADGHEVSTYADAALEEDIAETAAVYVALRGRPGLAEVREMFAARIALLDAWMSGRP